VGPAERSLGLPWRVGDFYYKDDGTWNGDTPSDFATFLIREVQPPVSEPAPEAEAIQYAATERDADGVWFGRPDNDGWIAWRGGECPMAPATLAEVRYRCNAYDTGKACDFRWTHTPADVSDHVDYDIVAYRVVPPEPLAPQQQYRPFASAEEFKPHCWRVLRSTCVANHYLIPSWFNDYGCARDGMTYEELIGQFVFDDNGEPCGVEVTQ
jgi:hypothetical protein